MCLYGLALNDGTQTLHGFFTGTGAITRMCNASEVNINKRDEHILIHKELKSKITKK